MKFIDKDKKQFTIAFFATSAIILLLLVGYLKYRYERINEKAYQELKNLSSIKKEYLLDYINEEKFKLNQLIYSEFFKTKFKELLKGKINIPEYTRFLNDVKSIKHLEDIIFISPEGKILFSFSVPDVLIDSITLKNLKNLPSPNVWIDVYKDNKSGVVYAFQIPLIEDNEKGTELLGFIRFQFDALSTLIPRIEFYDGSSSKEILLAKYDGNELIYLSYLRKIPIKPLNLYQELNENVCLDELFKNQEICRYEGLDYAGKPVFAIFQKIPNTNWILITKQNRNEILSEFRDQSIAISILFFIALLLIGSIFLFVSYRKEAQLKIQGLELEKSRRDIEQELEMISSQVSDAIFILNFKGEILKANKSAERMYGYKLEEIKGKTIDTICIVDELKELQQRFQKIERSDNYVYETTHRKKDGSLIEVEVNARVFTLDGNKYLIGSVRDISERKKALKLLQRKLEVEKFLTEIASEMINLNLSNFDENILPILNRVADFVKVDRIRLFLKDNLTGLFSCEIEWCRLGVESHKERLQFINFKEEYPYLYSLIIKSTSYKCVSLDELPEEGRNEKEELYRQGIQSFYWKPIKSKIDLIGLISFSTKTSQKNWTEEDDLIINIFSELLINVLMKIDFERKISESEKKFKKLIENSSDVILIVSKDFKNLYVSPSVVKVLGYTQDERVNQSPLDLIHPDDFDSVLETIKGFKKLGDQTTLRLRVKHKFGHYIWIEATITNLIEEPLINGYVVNYHDITEEVNAYNKLQESEERYRMLAEESGDVLYKLNYSTMKYDYISPVIKNLTGYTPEEISEIGFNQIVEEIYLILHPEKSKDQIKEDRIKGITGEYLADYKIRTKSGELKWVRDHSFPIYSNDGRVIGSIGILTDITELKKREEEIKKREKYLEVLVEIQKSLIFLTDLREFYNFMLPKIGQVTGASRCYVFENSIDENGRLLMSQVAEWVAEGVTPQINNPELQNLPYDVLGNEFKEELLSLGYWAKITKNLPEPLKSILESQEIVSILLIPIMIQDEFYGYIGFDECFTERIWTQMEIDILKSAAASIALAIESRRIQEEIIKAKDEIIEANRLKAGFLSLLSHEIRTPLNLIMGYNEVLQERFFDPNDEELKLYFNSIRNNSLRLLNTINQLIEISKLNAGALNVQIQELDLKKYIMETCNSMKVKADEKNLKLKCNLPQDDLIVLADDYCLHGILENLIMNSIKYSEKGEIEVTAYTVEDWIELKIKDEGIGISEEYLKHLFKPFSQEDVSYKRRYEGTGLGLAITKKYVELINGEIRVESKKGFGTTFFVKFKRAKVN
ncbi:MAG: PAS domain S-box protein [Ignavibacteria bacterium]|nr:PAS domain S-box protein [Ignavibacteria bacterium]